VVFTVKCARLPRFLACVAAGCHEFQDQSEAAESTWHRNAWWQHNDAQHNFKAAAWIQGAPFG